MTKLDSVNKKIDRLLSRTKMELDAPGFDPKEIYNLIEDFKLLSDEKMSILEEMEKGF